MSAPNAAPVFRDPRLTSLMQRLGVSLPAAEFIEVVTCAFQDCQALNHQDAIAKMFLKDASTDLLRQALSLDLKNYGAVQKVLVLGCGRGYAGNSADFAARVVEEAGFRVAAAIDVTPALLAGSPEGERGGFDLVVAHSLLHFLPDTGLALHWMLARMNPGAGLILGHEPNALFWRNEACQKQIQHLKRARKWRVLLQNPWKRRDAEPSLWERVNQKLIEERGWKGSLSEVEIRRLVDVHRPADVAGGFRIGSDGFEIDRLTARDLPGFRLRWSGSVHHLGNLPSTSLTPHWKSVERELAVQHPQAGSVWTAYWRRP